MNCLIEKWICAFLVIILGLFTNTVYGESLTLRDPKGSEIQFPVYLQSVSSTIGDATEDLKSQKNEDEPIPIPASLSTLKSLKKYLAYLPQAARDKDGQPVESTNINKDTLFANRLVKETIQDEVLKEDRAMLNNLYTLANFLNIRPLLNAFSSIIADIIYPLALNKEAQIAEKKEYKDISLEYLRILSIREALKDKGFKKDFPDELILRISKYIHLRKSGIEEFTIEDYIAFYGQPPMETVRKTEQIKSNGQTVEREVFRKKLSLANHRLTSLQGLDLIKDSHDVVELNLERNFFIGNDVDIDFPIAPFKSFPKLRNLCLEECNITKLPPRTFEGASNLRWLSLENNKLQEVGSYLEALPQLRWLYLNKNQLLALPSTAFRGSHELKLLCLDHNQLSTLPEGVFNNLKNLHFLSVNHNRLCESKAKFIQKYLGEKNLQLYFDNNDLLETKALREFRTESRIL